MSGLRTMAVWSWMFIPSVLSLPSCGPTAPGDAAPTRFVLELASGASGPVWVRETDDGNQPGWVRVAHADGERVYLRARCDVGECGRPVAVCGNAVPVVRDIASAGSIAFEWDGTDGTLDATSGCERRSAAVPGRYVATFCYARAAETSGPGSPAGGIQGTLVNPTCAAVPFEWPTATAVRYRVPAP